MQHARCLIYMQTSVDGYIIDVYADAPVRARAFFVSHHVLDDIHHRHSSSTFIIDRFLSYAFWKIKRLIDNRIGTLLESMP
ncbi:hypothetical protein X777_12570 [Ooceraea biroi]|uniref:Uncharacterized protein n=1 Tax=Ooceraea biroi TaxID=2015173 RepID=A0A026VZI9_OOCBI|nr:hypothetical protein X777_12570 [Ooceraea biroi]